MRINLMDRCEEFAAHIELLKKARPNYRFKSEVALIPVGDVPGIFMVYVPFESPRFPGWVAVEPDGTVVEMDWLPQAEDMK